MISLNKVSTCASYRSVMQVMLIDRTNTCDKVDFSMTVMEAIYSYKQPAGGEAFHGWFRCHNTSLTPPGVDLLNTDRN